MACRIIANGKEGFVVVCTRGGTTRTRCGVPGCWAEGAKLCDFPVERKGKPGTCDAKLCAQHATSVGEDKDYCPPHAKRAREREEAARGR